MPTSATRIVQNLLTNPGTGSPVCGRSVSFRLLPVGWIDGQAEVVAQSYATTAAAAAETPGLWSKVLQVNDGDYYTVRELPGLTWGFAVPAGDPAVPVWLHDCLTVAPQPGPLVVVGERGQAGYISLTDNGDGSTTINTNIDGLLTDHGAYVTIAV